MVEWSQIPENYLRGQPIGYNITYFPVNLESDINFVNVNFALNNTLLTNLTAYTTYFIAVSAVSSGGRGPANTVKAQTDAAGTFKSKKQDFLSDTSKFFFFFFFFFLCFFFFFFFSTLLYVMSY